MGARQRLLRTRLYVLITETLCSGPWFDCAAACLDGGATALQLREKDLDDITLAARTTRLRALCDRYDALLVLNDRPDIAAAAGAHGVHVGQDDHGVEAARSLLTTEQVIGVSTHTPEQVDAALRMAPDYIAVGPMFPTATKPQDHIAGPATLDAARIRTARPLVAIGGIHAGNVSLLQSADAVAVCSAVISAADCAQAARTLLAALAGG